METHLDYAEWVGKLEEALSYLTPARLATPRGQDFKFAVDELRAFVARPETQPDEEDFLRNLKKRLKSFTDAHVLGSYIFNPVHDVQMAAWNRAIELKRARLAEQEPSTPEVPGP